MEKDWDLKGKFNCKFRMFCYSYIVSDSVVNM